MMSPSLPWILALGAIGLVALVGAAWWWRRPRRLEPLPRDWALTPRPVFNTDERRLYRQLREALPHHIVLAKLPLVRFCQPADPDQVRYWYDLLGATHVTFAICSANGRVLAAIDFDHERGSRRATQIKQSVLGACRIRYLRCPLDHLPSIPELQLLVPQAGTPMRVPPPLETAAAGPPAPLHATRDAAASTPVRRRQRRPLWQDSGFFHDSFFGNDSRIDAGRPSEFSPYAPAAVRHPPLDRRPPPRPLSDWTPRAPDRHADSDDEPPRYGTAGQG